METKRGCREAAPFFSSFLRKQESRQTELAGNPFVVSPVEPLAGHEPTTAGRSFDRLRMSGFWARFLGFSGTLFRGATKNSLSHHRRGLE